MFSMWGWDNLAVTENEALGCKLPLQSVCGAEFKNSNLPEVAILATCNRWECYWYGPAEMGQTALKAFFRERLGEDWPDFELRATFKTGPMAISHLFRVSAGLASRVPGEYEILGQVKKCWQEAIKLGFTGPELNGLFQAALTAARKVRRQTGISCGKTAYASMILQLLREQRFPKPLQQALIIGTGQMAADCATVLTGAGIRVHFIAGRDHQKAQQLAARFQSDWSSRADLPGIINNFPAIIAAARSDEYLITPEMVLKIAAPCAIIDLSIPQITAPMAAVAPQVRFTGLDQIQRAIRENLAKRSTELSTAEVMAAEAVEDFIVARHQRRQQTQLQTTRERFWREGRAELDCLLQELPDQGLRRTITRKWERFLLKAMHIGIADAKSRLRNASDQHDNFFFPIVLSLKDRPILVVGGGAVAGRKIGKLLEAKGQVTVIAPELALETAALLAGSLGHWIQDSYHQQYLDGFQIVIAATDDPEVNRRIAADARRHSALVNSADGAAESDFIFPALLRRGDLLIAISTSGTDPALARRIREELELIFDAGDDGAPNPVEVEEHDAIAT
jgi:glutamyl-tRNA reductase